VSRAPLLVSAWGAVLIGHGVVVLVWSGLGIASLALLLAGMGALAAGALLAWRARPRDRVALPDSSPPALLFAVGLAVASGALVAGWWMALVGAAICLVAAGGLLRETLAMRRQVRR
jgi:hypothetical protein